MSEETPRASSPYSLIFHRGAHTGARAPLASDQVSVGSSGADVAVFDPAANDVLFRIDTRFGFWPLGPRVTVESGDVAVGGAAVPPGASRLVMTGAEISFGETAMALERAPGRFSRFAGVAALGGLGLIGLLMLAPEIISRTPAAQAPTDGRSLTEQGAAARIDARAAADGLNDRLRELGATGIAAQALPGELAVRVDGVLAADDVGRWRAAQEWFDSRYGGRVALWAKFGEPAAAIQLPFVIRSIWMEPTPAVQTDDGARRGVGDVLPGGWAISSIEQGALTIARDGQSLTIRY